jgi:hypothetical protein
MQKLVHVKPDGSGFVEERLLMTREALRMMQGMARTAAQPGDDAGFQLLDKDRLATQAVAMGPGVTLISAEALSTPEGEGYVARFAFTPTFRTRTATISHFGKRLSSEPGIAPVSKGSGLKKCYVGINKMF